MDSKHNEQQGNIQLFRDETTGFGKTTFGVIISNKKT